MSPEGGYLCLEKGVSLSLEVGSLCLWRGISLSRKIGSLCLGRRDLFVLEGGFLCLNRWDLSGGDKLLLRGVSLSQGVEGLLFLGGDFLVLRVWGCHYLSREEYLFVCFIIIIMSPGLFFLTQF